MKRWIRSGAASLLLLIASLGYAEAPCWWVERGVLDPQVESADYAPVNQGQLKQIAYQAYLELEGTLFGAGDSVAQRVSSFSNTNNHVAVNLGQLKYLAAAFYDHLLAIGLTNAWPQGMSSGPYPWSGAPHSAQDYAMANIGQAKHLFSFDIQVDTDGDGIPDWWEIFYFGGPTNAVASADPDGDGLTNLEEYYGGTHPLCAYVEGYGFDQFTGWLEGTSGTDGLMILLPSGQFRHVTEPLLAIFSYGVYGGE